MKRLLLPSTAILAFAVAAAHADVQPYFRWGNAMLTDQDVILSVPDEVGNASPDGIGLRYESTQSTVGYPATATPVARNIAAGRARYAIVQGALPSTMALDRNTGAITGTPVNEGDIKLSVQVEDLDGNRKIAIPVTLTVLPNATVAGVLPVVTSGGAVVTGAAYDATQATAVTASGVPLLVTFDRHRSANQAEVRGNLGSWTLEGLDSAGAWGRVTSGSTAGVYAFQGFTGRQFRLTYGGSSVDTLRLLSDGTGAYAPSVNAPGLLTPVLGQDFTRLLTSMNAQGANRYDVVGGTMPAGIRLLPDGTLSGNPTQPGASTAQVTVTDERTASAPASVAFMVASPYSAKDYLPTSASLATVPLLYDADVTAVSTTSLPAGQSLALTFDRPVRASGLNLVPSTNAAQLEYLNVPSNAWVSLGSNYNGSLSSFPEVSAASWRLTAQSGALPIQTVRLTESGVAPYAPSVTKPSKLQPEIGRAFTYKLQAQNASGTPTFSLVSGTFPTNITMDPDGTIKGTASTIQNLTVTVSVTDGRGLTSVAQPVDFAVMSERTAANLLPATVNGLATNVAALYDADAASFLQGSTTYVVDYGRPIQANGSTYSGDSGSPSVAYANSASGPWTTLGQANNTYAAPVTAQFYRLTVSSGSVYTFRMTSGGTGAIAQSVSPVAIQYPTVNVAPNLQLAALNASGTGVFAVAPGSAMPPGMDLTPAGLATGAPNAIGEYTANIVVTDDRGVVSAQKPVVFKVQTNLLASTVLPTKVAASALTMAAAYDADVFDANSRFPISSNVGFLVEYAEPVRVNFFYMAGSTSTNGTLDVAYQDPTGTFVNIGAHTYYSNNGTNLTESTSKVFRITPRATGSDVVGTLKLGYNQVVPAAPSVQALAKQTASLNQVSTWKHTAVDATAPLTFRLVSGALPAPMTLSDDGTVSGAASTVGDYSYSINVTDARGVTSAPKAMTAAVQSNVLASDVYPSSITANGSAASVAALYDNDSTLPYTVNSGGEVILTYAQAVRADSFLINGSAGSELYNATIQYLASDGTWKQMKGVGGAVTTASSTKFKIILGQYSSLTTAKAGNGSVYQTAPMVMADNARAPDTGSTTTWKLTPANITGTAAYQITAGTTAPDGLTVAPDGTVTYSPTTVGDYTYSVTVSDGRGLASLPRVMTLNVQSGILASTVFPSSATVSGSAFPVAALYDADASTQAYAINSGQEVILTFPQAVKANTVSFGGSNGSNDTYYATYYYLSTDGSWKVMKAPGGGVTAASSTRFKVTTGQYTSLNTLQFGYNNAYVTAPTLDATTTRTPDANAPVSYTITATNLGANPVFSSTGTLPPPLTLNANGTIVGTPTTPGDYTFGVTVRDDRGVTSLSKNQTINVQSGVKASVTLPTGITISGTGNYAAMLNDANDASPASQTYVNSSYDAVVTYAQSVKVDSLSMTIDGNSAQYPATVYYADKDGNWITLKPAYGNMGTASSTRFRVTMGTAGNLQTLQLGNANVYPAAPSVNAVATRTPTVNVAPGYTAGGSNLTGNGRYTVVSGALPTGMTLDPGGAFLGAPSSVGDFAFSVQVIDDRNLASVARPMVMSVQSDVTAAGVLPNSVTIGGSGAHVARLFDNDTTAESQVSIGSSQDVVFTYPQAVKVDTFRYDNTGGNGQASFTVWYQDMNGGAWVVMKSANGSVSPGSSKLFKVQTGASGTVQTLKLGYGNAFPSAPSVNALGRLTPVAGVDSTTAIRSSDVSGTARYAVATGSLPPGMALDLDGTLHGAPSTVADYTFGVTVTDDRNVVSLPRSFTVSVQSAVAAGGVLPTSLTIGGAGDYRGLLYDNDTTAESQQSVGGAQDIVYTFAQPVRVDSFSMNSTGGTIYNATVSYLDATSGAYVVMKPNSGSVMVGSSRTFKVVTNAGGAVSTLKLGYGNVFPTAPSVTSQALRTIALNVGTTLNHGASGVTGTGTYSLAGGAVPTGMTPNADGTVTGTPTAAGTFTYTLKVNDDASGVTSVARSFSVKVQ